jgi:hypothetical protein
MPTVPSDVAATPRRSGRRVVISIALVASVVLGWLNGLFWWFWATFSFDTPEPGQYRWGAGVCFATAALLAVLSVFATWALDAPRWIAAAALVAAGTLVALGIHSNDRAGDVVAESSFYDDLTMRDGLVQSLWGGTWPLIAMAVLGTVRLVRGRSRPGPRRPPGR